MKRINHFAVLFGFVWTFAAHAQEWSPSVAFLQAVREIESCNGLNRYGDSGDSLGDFQLSEAAWLDVNEWRRARSLKIYPYDPTVYHPFISRVYASNFLTILHSELSRKLKRPPSPGEVYAAYNLGLSTFAQCDYDLQRVNSTTRERCRLLTERFAPKESL